MLAGMGINLYDDEQSTQDPAFRLLKQRIDSTRMLCFGSIIQFKATPHLGDRGGELDSNDSQKATSKVNDIARLIFADAEFNDQCRSLVALAPQ